MDTISVIGWLIVAYITLRILRIAYYLIIIKILMYRVVRKTKELQSICDEIKRIKHTARMVAGENIEPGQSVYSRKWD